MDAPRPHPHAAAPRRRRAGRAALAVAALAGLASAWTPLALEPPPSLADATGRLHLGGGDVVLQRRPEGCALAVLAMLLAGRGIRTDEDALARLAGDRLGPHGLTLAAVAAVAADAGLNGRWLAAAPADLDALVPPYAAQLAGAPGAPADHLVVVRRATAHGLLVADPAVGLVVWPRDAFLSAWTGRVFVAAPS